VPHREKMEQFSWNEWFVLDSGCERGLFLQTELHFSLMSASSELEPHPSGVGMSVRVRIAPPETSSARMLEVRVDVLAGAGARGRRSAWRRVAPG
jgi:hypothetical protein